MIVLVCGGRDFSDSEKVASVLGSLSPRPTLLIHGGASGADELAQWWCDAISSPPVPTKVFKADWGRWGKSAGPKRNQLMLESSAPDLVVAFPGGRGTADMVRRATLAKIPVLHP